MTSSITSLETGLVDRVSDIHRLDERISMWWSNVPQRLKLKTLEIPTADPYWLPRILLLNIVYHQSLCALHASIVPLFCWAVSEEKWALARKTSAQIAYEHACSVSAMIDAVLSHYPKLAATPAFVSYAAYCSCAIQIPFIWSADAAVSQRAQLNVRANIRMIRAMAKYWKLADLLVSRFWLTYTSHWLMTGRESTSTACIIFTENTT